MKLQKPVYPFILNQKFGENKNDFYKKSGMLGHNGLDLRCYHGQPVYASHDGFASYQIDSAGGHGVVIITDKEVEYKGQMSFMKTIYWHLADGLKEPKLKSPVSDKTFVKVKTGEIIGYADNTGQSTGTHLHFGLKPVARGENWGTSYNTEQNNGYYGAIDPLPFLEDLSEIEKEIKKVQSLVEKLAEQIKKFLANRKI